MVAREPAGCQVMTFLRVGVGKYTDHTGTADGENRNDHIIIAAEHYKVITQKTGDAHGIADVSAGFLDADDIRMLGQTFDGTDA